MTDNVQIAIIVAIGPTVVSCLAILHQVMVERVAKAEREEARRDRLALKADVKTIEVATNHMKDALVAAALKEGHSIGKEEGILIQKAEQQQQIKYDKPST